MDYLLTCNFAEVAIIFLGTLFLGLDEPLLFPVQLLWINLLTDGLVALALGVDPPAADIMQKKPRKDKSPLVNKRTLRMILLIGSMKTIILLLIFWWVQPSGLPVARSVLFTGIVLFEFVRIGAIRSQEQLGWFANQWLAGSLAVSFLLQLIILYSPLNTYFYLIPLGIYEWGLLLVSVVTAYFLAVLISKMVLRYTPE
jgi:Ca2+-transporting ATPase